VQSAPDKHRFGVSADYVEGDPTQPGPLPGGVLALAPGGLIFSWIDGSIAAELDELEGITVTGSRVRRPGFEAGVRGYTKVALIRGQTPIVWEFAIDRDEGTALRERLNRLREVSGRVPLPFVEELGEFGERANTQATGEMPALDREAVSRSRDAARPRATRTRNRPKTPARPETRTRRSRQRLTTKQRRLVLAGVGTMVFLEIAVPLLVLKVF
jgi:hypothetical protein